MIIRSDVYDINVLDVDFDIKKTKEIVQLAYAVDPDRFEILISRSGHGKLMRGRNKHQYQGGWLMPRKGIITFYSGFLGKVDRKDDITRAISSALGIYLREKI